MNFSKAELKKLPYKVDYEDAVQVITIEFPLNEEKVLLENYIVDPNLLNAYKEWKNHSKR